MIEETIALTNREIKKWIKNPYMLFMMLVQPILWLGLFGKALNLTGLTQIPVEKLPPYVTQDIRDLFNRIMSEAVGTRFGGTTDYFTYMAAGMLSFVMLGTAMFSGMSIVWDRRLGFLNKLLVAPIPAGSIILSKIASSVVRGMLQVLLIFGIAFAFGLQVGNAFGVLDFLGVLAAMFLLGLGLSALFLAITIRIKSHNTVIAFSNLLNLPLMFASNALFPIDQMPTWLQLIAKFNPLSYATDAVRAFILHSTSRFDLATVALDFEVLAGFALVFSLVGILVARRGLRKG